MPLFYGFSNMVWITNPDDIFLLSPVFGLVFCYATQRTKTHKAKDKASDNRRTQNTNHRPPLLFHIHYSRAINN